MPEPLLVRVAEAMRLTGWGRTTLYRKAAAGEIEFRKAGKTTLVTYASLKAAVARLPVAKINVQ